MKIDFDFIYNLGKDTYGHNGNESVPPILKRMPFLFLCIVRSDHLFPRFPSGNGTFSNLMESYKALSLEICP